MWKKRSSKIILSHPWIEVWEDEVELPNGEITTYVRYPSGAQGVTVVAQNTEGKILIQSEYSYPVGAKLLEFPGGGINKGESPEEGAKRELIEEAGFDARHVKPIGWFYMNNRRSDAKMHVLIARDLEWRGTKHGALENPQTFWYDVEQIDQMIARGEIVNWSILAAWSLVRPHLSSSFLGLSC